jgi:hypothetical protein
MLKKQELNIAYGLGAGFFADGVAAHAVGDYEQVPMSRIAGRISGGLRRTRVLIMAPLDPNIRQGRELHGLVCRHRSSSRNFARLQGCDSSYAICRRPALFLFLRMF